MPRRDELKWVRARIPKRCVPLATMLAKMPKGRVSTWVIDACLEKMQRDTNEPTLRDVMQMLEVIRVNQSVMPSLNIVPTNEPKKVKANMRRMME